MWQLKAGCRFNQMPWQSTCMCMLIVLINNINGLFAAAGKEHAGDASCTYQFNQHISSANVVCAVHTAVDCFIALWLKFCPLTGLLLALCVAGFTSAGVTNAAWQDICGQVRYRNNSEDGWMVCSCLAELTTAAKCVQQIIADSGVKGYGLHT